MRYLLPFGKDEPTPVASVDPVGLVVPANWTWYTLCMTTQVPVRLTESDLAELDAAVARGRFSSRSEALRAGLQRVLDEERQQEIDDAYAAGYRKHPQEERVGEVGLAGLVAFDNAEGG